MRQKGIQDLYDDLVGKKSELWWFNYAAPKIQNVVCLRPRNLLLLAQKISRGITNPSAVNLWDRFTGQSVPLYAVPDAIL